MGSCYSGIEITVFNSLFCLQGVQMVILVTTVSSHALPVRSVACVIINGMDASVQLDGLVSLVVNYAQRLVSYC